MPTPVKRFRSFGVYPALAALLVAAGEILEPGRPMSAYFVPAALGCVSWSGIEYALHRFCFHPTTSNPRLDRALRGLHGAHHSRPREPEWIFTRLRISLPLSLLLLLLAYAVTGNLTATAGMMIGVWAGFLYYEWVHYRVHTSSATLGLEGQRRRHFQHHFVDETRGFGVTSPLWDIVLGTRHRSLSTTTGSAPNRRSG